MSTEIKTVRLDRAIMRGEQEITSLGVRNANSGELRGVSLVDLSQLQVNTLVKLIPRVTVPNLTEHEVEQMSVADMMAIGVEIASFLLPKESRTVSLDPPTMQ